MSSEHKIASSHRNGASSSLSFGEILKINNNKKCALFKFRNFHQKRHFLRVKHKVTQLRTHKTKKKLFCLCKETCPDFLNVCVESINLTVSILTAGGINDKISLIISFGMYSLSIFRSHKNVNVFYLESGFRILEDVTYRLL